MARVGLIGAGAIGMALVEAFAKEVVAGHRLAAVLARPHQIAALRRLLGDDVLITDEEAVFLRADVALVIEATGHQGAIQFAPPLLERGRDVYLMSVGVLADPAVNARFLDAAGRGGARIVIPSGALAGFDGLRALAALGLTEVTYTSTKPPHAWLGTPADDLVRHQDPSETIVIFEGSAAEAALRFPKNANLAAAVALAGVGLERTRVRLVSDPAADGNTGAVFARAGSTVMELSVAGVAFADNPKSSQLTSASIIAALTNRASSIRYA